MAGDLLVIIRRFFNWVIDQHVYGLTASPCDRLSVVKLVGPMSPSRTRRLNDDRAVRILAGDRADEIPGRVRSIGMLLLTGLRLNECAQLSWKEVQGDTIIIPARADEGQGTAGRASIWCRCRRRRRRLSHRCRAIGTAQYLFSFNAGKRPLKMSSPIKHDLDRRMLRTLKAMARRRGEDHHTVELENWTNHDLRRVVRTGSVATPGPARRRRSCARTPTARRRRRLRRSSI